MTCFVGFLLFVAALMVWALVIAPRMGRNQFARLEGPDWERVAADDGEVQAVLDAIAPRDLMTRIGRRESVPSASVLRALRSRTVPTRYLAQLRMLTIDDEYSNVMTSPTVALGRAAPGFGGATYLVSKHMETILGNRPEALELRAITSGLDAGFRETFAVLGGAGAVVPPSRLQQALLESAGAFVSGAGERGAYLPRLVLCLAPGGWALFYPEPIVTEGQLRSFVATAGHVAAALSSEGADATG